MAVNANASAMLELVARDAEPQLLVDNFEQPNGLCRRSAAEDPRLSSCASIPRRSPPARRSARSGAQPHDPPRAARRGAVRAEDGARGEQHIGQQAAVKPMLGRSLDRGRRACAPKTPPPPSTNAT